MNNAIAPERPTTARVSRWKWGASWPQRLRLLPLFAAAVLADLLASTRRSPRPQHGTWKPGVSVIIPERDAPELLKEALTGLFASLVCTAEPSQVIVAVNGAPRSAYAWLEQCHPEIEIVHSDAPLPFAAAIERGLAHARHDWTLLLNNDMTLNEGAVPALALLRADDVFAIGAQIFQSSASGRREETGFTDWYVDGDGVHLFHVLPTSPAAVPQLCASGGAALFRTRPLRRYMAASRAYDPFYWEDAEWSVRAWRDGWKVLFAPAAHAHHRHRATTARFFDAAELERIIERNRILFDARHAITAEPLSVLMNRVCDLPYVSQRELAGFSVARGVLQQRMQARRRPQPMRAPTLWRRNGQACILPSASYSYRLRSTISLSRPKLLLVTPFAVFPPRHGGARRIGELIGVLKRDYDIILVSDEARLYDGRSFTSFDGLLDVRLVQRPELLAENGIALVDASLLNPAAARLCNHVDDALKRTVADAIAMHRPAIVQVEYAELAQLVCLRSRHERWVLGLHDACGPEVFASDVDFERFENETLSAYDAITVCSTEDAALIRQPHVICVPNASAIPLGRYIPSSSLQLLFIGPFRYGPNLAGIKAFLSEAYPAIRASIPAVELLVLGGDEALAVAGHHSAFTQPGVVVLGHRDDMPVLFQGCALTINPLMGIRGSALKLVESMTAGRICVSTEDGARGFHAAGFEALVKVPDIAAMATPIIRLLGDAGERHEREAPVTERLRPLQWDASAKVQRRLYQSLLTKAKATMAWDHVG